MKYREFTYLKEGGHVERYALLILNETDQDVSGVSMGALPKEDQEKIIAATRAYEAALAPYFSQCFRRFKKGHIVDVLKETK